MKKFATSILAALMLVATAEAKTLPVINSVMSVTELTPEMINNLIEGMYSDVTLQFQEGTALPLQFLVRNKLFSLKFDPKLTIKVETSGYIRFINKKTYMSLDGINWEKPEHFINGDSATANVKISPDKSHIVVEVNVPEAQADSSDED